MSGGFRPNEQMSLPGLGVPVDPCTGELLRPEVLRRIRRLKEAEVEFCRAMHELDGSSEGSRPGDRRMMHAFNKFEEVIMWAEAAILGRGSG
jgi:hypothetical protein